MGTSQVRLDVPSLLPNVRANGMKASKFSFSETLKTESRSKAETTVSFEKEAKKDFSSNPSKVSEETVQSDCEKDSTNRETKVWKEKDVGTEEKDAGSDLPLNKEEEGNKEEWMSLLASFITDLARNLGVEESELKEFMLTHEVGIEELPDMNTWKAFIMEKNGLSNMNEFLTEEVAFDALDRISDFLDQWMDTGEMKQLTAGLTEGGMNFKEFFMTMEKESPIFPGTEKDDSELIYTPESVDISGVTEDMEFAPITADYKEETFSFQQDPKETETVMSGKDHLPMQGNKLFDHLIQNIKNLEAGDHLPEGVNVKELLSQVTNQIKTLHAPDRTTLELLLQPATLGKVLIQVSSKNGVMQAELKVESQEAKNALMQSLADLKISFENQGFKVSEVEITLSEAGIGQRDEEGSSKEGEKRKKNGNRRISLEIEDANKVSAEESEPLYVSDSAGKSVDYVV